MFLARQNVRNQAVWRLILAVLLSVFFSVWVPRAWANNGLLPYAGSEVVGSEHTPDSLGRDTPRSALAGLMSAYASGDKKLVAQYLDDKYLMRKGVNDAEVVRDLKRALDAGGRLLPSLQISDNPEGDRGDLLPNDVDKVGTIDIGGNSVDVLMVRRSDKAGHFYWQVADATLQSLPETQMKQPQFIQKFGVGFLEPYKIFGHSVSDLIGLLVLIFISIFLVYLGLLLMFWAARWVYPKIIRKEFRVTQRMLLPLTMIVVAIFLSEIMLKAGVPVTLRTPVGQVKEAVAWAATTWLLLRLLDTVFSQAEALSLRKNRPEQVSILGLLRKLAKVLLLILAVIVVFGNLGFDLTTGIAALGVGGLALAFGAQKTVENLIGSVVVVADRPVHIGDYCKFGTYEGVVIDIGIRSTQVRTLNRTVVTIPNGEFSALQIENYAVRDMFHFLHNLYIKRSTPLYDLHHLVKELKAYLDNHPDVNNEWTQVRISELRQDCYVVEMRAYIITRDVVVFYDKQTQLILELLQKVEDLGVEHAMPTRDVMLTMKAQDEDKSAELLQRED